MQLIAHGGAGSPPEDPASRRAVLEEAVAFGADAETPLEAVCATVRVLEVDPGFNAGVGSAVQSDGRIRTDAGVMRSGVRTDSPGAARGDDTLPREPERSRTDRRAAGAACSLPDVCHAVSVARAVLTETPHVLLAGERAVEFAAAEGVETGVDCWTDATRERWADLGAPGGTPAEQLAWVRERFGTDPARREGASASDGSGGRPVGAGRDAPHSEAKSDTSGDAGDHAGDTDHDTVGAVACDGETVASATSTGGRWCALAGRVGDVPQIGAGFYAAPAGAASATGAGEDIARHTLSREAVGYLERGADAGTAARLALGAFDDLTESEAGLIVVDAEGNAGAAHNTAAMQTARN